MNSIRFMYAAYVATWAILGGYIVSIGHRYRHMRKQRRDLEQGK